MWSVHCKDGLTRFLPYANKDDAEMDATLLDRLNGCDTHLWQDRNPLVITKCPGGPHVVKTRIKVG